MSAITAPKTGANSEPQPQPRKMALLRTPCPCAQLDLGTGEHAPFFVPVEDPEIPLFLGNLVNPPSRPPLQALSVALFPAGVPAEGSSGHRLEPQKLLQKPHTPSP